VNARDSLRQTSPHGYQQVLLPGSDAQAWWLNAPAEAVNLVPYADHLTAWSPLLNSVEKPAAADGAVPFGPIRAEHLATGLKVGFAEV